MGSDQSEGLRENEWTQVDKDKDKDKDKEKTKTKTMTKIFREHHYSDL